MMGKRYTLGPTRLVIPNTLRTFRHRPVRSRSPPASSRAVPGTQSGKGESLTPPPHTTGHAGPHPAVHEE